MRLTYKKIINLPAYTQSGDFLGRVASFEVDSLNQKITQYHLKSSNLINELMGQELIVASNQVIEITEKKMTVEDTLIKEKEKVFGKSKLRKGKMALPVLE